MLKKFSILASLMLVLFLFNLNCEKKTTKGGERTDWEAIKAIIYENPDIFLVDVFDTNKDTTVNPVFFREITSRNLDLKEGTPLLPPDSLQPFEHIYAPWEDSIKGVFHYFMDGKEYTKPIYAYSLTYGYFERWGDIYDIHRGWLLKKISGNVINSLNTNPRQLYTLRITSSKLDTIINEIGILNLVRFNEWWPNLDSILRFSLGEKVTFTIEPKDTTDYLFLYIGEDGNFQKFPFLSNGNGTFSASWTTTNDSSVAKGYKHAFVDAVSRDAVSDTTAKYDAKAWGIIYRIK
jgi:hypothetical protein